MLCVVFSVIKTLRLSVTTCQDVSSLGRGANVCQFVCSCVSYWSSVTKTLRLSVTTCQDVSSLGRGANVCQFVCI